MTETPLAASDRTISNSRTTSREFRAAVGSSMMMTRAFTESARADFDKPDGSKTGSSVAEGLLIEREQQDYFDLNDRFCVSVSCLIYFSVLSAAMLLRKDIREGFKPCFPPWACTFSPSFRVHRDRTGIGAVISTKEFSEPNCSSRVVTMRRSS